MDENKLTELLKISKTIKLLYVEDKEDVRESTSELLERFVGYVDVAVDGREGIQKYIDFHKDNGQYYDLVISDIDMPHMNGIEMTRAISEINKEQAILIISAFSNSEMLINLIDIGINKFIQKPTKDHEFFLVLSKMLNDISIEKENIENIKNIKLSNIKLEEKIQQELSKNIELNALAITDKLTGLYNRVKLDKVLDLEINKMVKLQAEISIIFIDIDRFKPINDTYGHQIGDKVLQSFSQVLKNNIRKTDIVGRWGGEEFLIICHEANIEGSLHLAENLRKIIENTSFEYIKELTASFGVASFEDGDSIDSLVERADKALYKAKHNGRNKVCF
ncbi:response regulator receiver (CheY-like) modulated diguanylate cyclase [Sulfurimonas gotlandica GD1]|uniref:diguanylate cyclase n=1 Tax=Sulfurimonas gotlandica (strain DSM 19862 / JCM 16533 / GD1) TaxID=929558 RepID=B6BGM9_SULGG|nr:diguanylate cyclase [Sulfurimonas gotlandica]EDZ63080.1 diguanylate cyclase [Sulfurimonas gotlandica GD1]EHP29659.1 response regulator receiver (CheY-like) modulated diguanylate cyclase [Sulfurimonas gotlandica GD1]